MRSRQTFLSLLSALAVAVIAGTAVAAMSGPATAMPSGPPSATALADTDGDSLPDDWEINGYDANGDGTVDVDLPAMGASPYAKDIFVETDYMAGRLAPVSAFHRIVQVFATAPVDNPDGTRGIRLHLDAGPIYGSQYNLGGGSEIPHDPVLDAQEVYAAKAAHQTKARAAVFYYILFADQYTPGCGGWAFGQPGDLALVALGPACSQPSENNWVGVFVHELGHLLGLNHGGAHLDFTNWKPNYLSVMNYVYTYRGVLRADGASPYFGYSESALPPLTETSLAEPRGLGTPSADEWRAVYFCPDSSLRTSGPAGQPIDWNCDGDTSDTAAQVDLNNDGKLGQLDGHADWSALRFGGGAVGDPAGTAPKSFPTTVIQN